MANYTAQIASGAGTGGRTIPIAATSTPGTILHTATSGSVNFDEVYLWVSNVTGSAVPLTVEWGGTSDPADHLVKGYSIPANSPPIPIATGIRVNNGLVIRAFAGTTNALNATLNINHIA